MSMSKKETCVNNETIAYISTLGGVEIKKIEYGINDYVYCVINAWNKYKSYHRVKINYGNRPYIVVRGYRLYMDEAIRM